MPAKFDSGVAIALAASASDDTATPTKYLVCESANIIHTPKYYKRRPNTIPWIDHVVGCGFDYTFEVNGITADAGVFGYLMFLFLGGDAYSTNVHTLTPDDTGVYCNLWVDRQEDIEDGGTGTVHQLLGCRITSVSIEFPQNDFMKMSISGKGCDMGNLAETLTPSIPTGDDNHPIHWNALKTANGGYFKIGLNDAAVGQDDDVEGFKCAFTRNAFESGVSIGSAQPTALTLGLGEGNFEINKTHTGSDAEDQVDAFNGQENFEIDLKASMGSTPYYITMAMKGKPSGNPFDNVGAEDDTIKLNFPCDAFKPEGGDMLTVTVREASTALYT